MSSRIHSRPMARNPVITIDGPAGAGKSTVARMVAKRLGLRFLDTGAMYRAFTWKALETGVSLSDVPRLVALVRGSSLTFESGRVFMDGRDITRDIRAERVTRSAVQLADAPEVRAELVRLQREFGREGGLVTEGRDQGTVVFPDAERKFFLDASIEVRARRRLQELEARDETVDLDELMRGIAERDEKDRRRPVGAMRVPPDAATIDTSNLTVEQVVEEILRRVRGAG